MYADALQVYYRVAAKYEAQLENARRGRPINSFYDKAKRKRLKNCQAASNDPWAYLRGTDLEEYFDPEYDSIDAYAQDIEQRATSLRIREVKLLRDTGRMDARRANEEIDALEHLNAGTVPKNEPLPSTLPYLAKVVEEYFEEIAPTLKKVTLNKKRTHIALFIKWIKNKPIDQYSLKDGNEFLARLKKLQAKGKPKGQKIKPNSEMARFVWTV